MAHNNKPKMTPCRLLGLPMLTAMLFAAPPAFSCKVANLLPAQQSTISAVSAKTLFSNQDAQYRIPAIVTCKSGRIIAFADHRYDNKDIGEGRHIDIVMKTSKDKGKTWSEPEQIMARGGSHVANDFDCAHGDAAAVVDRESGEVLVMCASGGIGFWESTREKPQIMGRYYSKNEGKTWKGEDVTAEIYAVMPGIGQAFFSSGRICQSSKIKVGTHYRIYSAITTLKGNRVLYSDDFGKHWLLLGDNAADAAPMGDEAKIEELPDGSVLISSRFPNGRLFNTYKYKDEQKATGTWDTAVFSYAGNKGVEASSNACNGEILLVKAKKEGKKVNLLLQSVPLGPGRSKVAIYYKSLGTAADYATPAAIAKDWEGCYLVSDTTSAYSTMTQGKDGDILLLYEENAFRRNPKTEPDDYYDIQFMKLGIQEITNHQYR